LNGSLALSAAELWPAKVWPKRANYAFSEKLVIRPNTERKSAMKMNEMNNIYISLFTGVLKSSASE